MGMTLNLQASYQRRALESSKDDLQSRLDAALKEVWLHAALPSSSCVCPVQNVTLASDNGSLISARLAPPPVQISSKLRRYWHAKIENLRL